MKRGHYTKLKTNIFVIKVNNKIWIPDVILQPNSTQIHTMRFLAEIKSQLFSGILSSQRINSITSLVLLQIGMCYIIYCSHAFGSFRLVLCHRANISSDAVSSKIIVSKQFTITLCGAIVLYLLYKYFLHQTVNCF